MSTSGNLNQGGYSGNGKSILGMLIFDRHFDLKESLVRICKLHWYLKMFPRGNMNGDEIRMRRNSSEVWYSGT